MRHNYPQLIGESVETLEALEAKHRNSVIGSRMRMLRLLKSGEATSMLSVSKQIHYSLRHSQRWWKVYRERGLAGLLEPLKEATGGQPEWMTPAAWEGLKEALLKGEIGSYAQARKLLATYGVVYKDDTSVLKLFRRHGIKAKTGRPQHQKSDLEAQAAFKKTSRVS